MVFEEKEREIVELIDEGMAEFMSLATKAMLILRGLEILGAGRKMVDMMWSRTYKELYGNISKLSLEDIAHMLDSKGDEKHE